jgi:hypothetical protein
MAITRWVNIAGMFALAQALNGCASTKLDQLAMIETKSAATDTAIIAILRQAMGTQNISLGPRDGDLASVVTVLPPALGRYETRSVALPELFDVIKRKNDCYLVRRTTGVAYALKNVGCEVPPPLIPKTGR